MKIGFYYKVLALWWQGKHVFFILGNGVWVNHLRLSFSLWEWLRNGHVSKVGLMRPEEYFVEASGKGNFLLLKEMLPHPLGVLYVDWGSHLSPIQETTVGHGGGQNPISHRNPTGLVMWLLSRLEMRAPQAGAGCDMYLEQGVWQLGVPWRSTGGGEGAQLRKQRTSKQVGSWTCIFSGLSTELQA